VGAGGEPVLFGPVFSNLTRVVSSGFSCLIEKSRQESTSRSDTRDHQRHSLERAPNRTCSPTAPNSIPDRRPSRGTTSETAAPTSRPSRRSEHTKMRMPDTSSEGGLGPSVPSNDREAEAAVFGELPLGGCVRDAPSNGRARVAWPIYSSGPGRSAPAATATYNQL
jgi:hypothetical protein